MEHIFVTIMGRRTMLWRREIGDLQPCCNQNCLRDPEAGVTKALGEALSRPLPLRGCHPIYQVKRCLWPSHKRQAVIVGGERQAVEFAQRKLVLVEVVGNTWEPVVGG